MRSAWIVGGLGLLFFATGCCGACGTGCGWGRNYPQQTYTPSAQYPTAQYGVPAESYASSQGTVAAPAGVAEGSYSPAAPAGSTSLSSAPAGTAMR